MLRAKRTCLEIVEYLQAERLSKGMDGGAKILVLQGKCLEFVNISSVNTLAMNPVIMKSLACRRNLFLVPVLYIEM